MLDTFLKQKATYWIGEPDGYGGYTWSDPVVIDVRWQENRELTKDSEGNEVVSNTQVWTMENIPYEAKMYKGETTETNPDNLDTYDIIKKANRVDLDGNEDGYKVWL